MKANQNQELLLGICNYCLLKMEKLFSHLAESGGGGRKGSASTAGFQYWFERTVKYRAGYEVENIGWDIKLKISALI